MHRAAEACADAGLAGLVFTPGPDLFHLTGYKPVAITERITALVLAPGHEPALLMPRLERPDAERSPAADRIKLSDWTDGSDPYAAAAAGTAHTVPTRPTA